MAKTAFAEHYTISQQEEFLCSGCVRSASGLAVTTSSEASYHLHCYALPSFLRLDSTLLSIDIDELSASYAEALLWVQRHNSLFRLPDLPHILRFSRRLPSLVGPVPRSFLETAKFLCRMEVALVLSRVSKAWHDVSWHEELWTDFRVGETKGKLGFIFATKTRCFRCGLQLTDAEEIGLLLPGKKQPLCVSCRNAREMRLISTAAFCKLRGIARKHSRHFASLSVDRHEFAFLETASQTLVSLRASFRRAVVRGIQRLRPRDEEEAIAALRALELEQDFQRKLFDSHPYSDLIRAVLTLAAPKQLRLTLP